MNMTSTATPGTPPIERFREVEEWITHEGNEWIFSFDNVCEFLGLDPEYLRRGLREMDRHGSGSRAA